MKGLSAYSGLFPKPGYRLKGAFCTVNKKPDYLFWWESESYIDMGPIPSIDVCHRCFWCNTRMVFTSEIEGQDWEFYETKCPLCGYYSKCEVDKDIGGDWRPHKEFAVLKEFDINGPELSVGELASCLKKFPDKINDISSWKFEELVSDIFKNQHFDTQITKRTRDGGADILLYDPKGKIAGIVECKQYKKQKIGVDIVRSVAGAGILFESKKIYIATSGSFSKPSGKLIQEYGKHGYELDFYDGQRILNELEVYNAELPPLFSLDKQTIQLIIGNNSRNLKNSQ